MTTTESFATSPGVRARMQKQPSLSTMPERRLRSELHGRGLRFRIHRRLLPGYQRATDVVFGPSRVAVYIDGCFWHGCPMHYKAPRANTGYWLPKIDRNRGRDAETTALLTAAGWLVIRVWEHESVSTAADLIERAVRERRTHL